MLGRPGADKNCSMDRVSRPLIGLLVATVAFFALWVTMLKPSASTSGANAGNIAKNPSLGQLSGAIAAAHAAVASTNGASVRSGGAIVAPCADASGRRENPPRTRDGGATAPTRPVTRPHAGVHARPMQLGRHTSRE